VDRSALSYCSVRAERDALTLEAMKRLAAQYPRYGYRRIRFFCDVGLITWVDTVRIGCGAWPVFNCRGDAQDAVW
jgi:hypothetical protein